MLQYCGKLEIYDQPVQIYMLYCTQFFSRLHRSSFFILNARFLCSSLLGERMCIQDVRLYAFTAEGESSLFKMYSVKLNCVL